MEERFDLGFGIIKIWPNEDTEGSPRIYYASNYSGYADLPEKVRDMWLEVAHCDHYSGHVRGDYGAFSARWRHFEKSGRVLSIECNPRGVYYGLSLNGNVRTDDLERFIAVLEKCRW